MSDGGKGSSPRPFSVSEDEWATRWDSIFARDLDKKKQAQEKLGLGEDGSKDEESN